MMMPVARLALLRAYPRSELLAGPELCHHAGTGGADSGPGTRRGICDLGQLALDFPDKHSDRRNWAFCTPVNTCQISQRRADSFDIGGFSVVWLKSGVIFQRY